MTGNTRHDLSGDAHADGEIWSRVLWDVRAALGPEMADVLALESSFYLPPAATLVEAGQALLDADASLFDGAASATPSCRRCKRAGSRR